MPQPARFPLMTPLIRLSPHDTLTFRDAFEGIQIFGGLGSGKTTGSGQTLAKAFLRSGFGGLVLTAKPDEARLWARYAAECGRESSMLYFGPKHPWRFNFIDYEMRRPGEGAGVTSNIVALIENVLESHNPDKVVGGDPYWRQARSQVLRNAIDLIQLAGRPLSLEDVFSVIRSAPLSAEDRNRPAWHQDSFCAQLFREALARCEQAETQTEAGDLRTVANYFFTEWAPLDPEPRSSIRSMVGALMDIVVRGDVRKLLLSKTNFTPDLAESGTVIVVDMPIHEWRDAGKFVQVLFKTVFQRMLDRRQHRDDDARPIFIWADESSNFMTQYDTEFQTVARAARVATVYLTQNLPNYIAAFGGDEGGRTRADQLLGALGIKIFHANGDVRTNQYIQELGGQELVWRESFNEGGSSSTSSSGTTSSKSWGTSYNQVVDHVIRAKWMTELSRGGPDRGWSEAFVFRAGDPWRATNTNVLNVRFPQVVTNTEASS